MSIKKVILLCFYNVSQDFILKLSVIKSLFNFWKDFLPITIYIIFLKYELHVYVSSTLLLTNEFYKTRKLTLNYKTQMVSFL